MNIQVGIVEDNPGLRNSLSLIIDSESGYECAWTCSSAEEVRACLKRCVPQVILMDLHLPGQSGIECVRSLRHDWPKIQVIMLTIEDNIQRVYAALAAGAVGYLVKNVTPAKLLEAIKEVSQGGSPMSSQIARMLVRSFEEPGQPTESALSPREAEVLQKVSRGYRSKEIAADLNISSQTVETHLRNIYQKLQVRSRAEAVMKYFGPTS
jgi:DNA-binding NarL/FixJ family response regulator